MATKPIYTQMLLILTYFVALIISLYQEINYMLTQQYIFNIVWMYTYSIRLFLNEAKHRYKGKNINRKRTLKIYKVQKVYS